MITKFTMLTVGLCFITSSLAAQEYKGDKLLKKFEAISKRLDELEKNKGLGDAKTEKKTDEDSKKTVVKKPVETNIQDDKENSTSPPINRGAADIPLDVKGSVQDSKKDNKEKSVLVDPDKKSVDQKSKPVDDSKKSVDEKGWTKKTDKNGTKTNTTNQKVHKKSDQPLVDLEINKKTKKPSKTAILIESLLLIDKNSELTGKKESLVESLGSVMDRSQQQKIVVAYWQLCDTVAFYNIATSIQQEIISLTDQDQKTNSDAIRAAIARAEAEVTKARANVIIAQHVLNNAKQIGSSDTLPLPSDRPHVGNYRTQFDQISTFRSIDSSLRQIHQTLPLRRKVIAARTEAVLASLTAIRKTRETYQRGGVLPSQMILSIWLSQQHQVELITSVNTYNREIAQYALGVASGNVDQQTLVGMLIKTEHSPKDHTVLKPVKVQRNTSGWILVE